MAQMANNAPAECKELTPECATEVFEKYKAELKAQNKSASHAQFGTMYVEAFPPDEVRIIAPSEFVESYAKEDRNKLIDFFRKDTGIVALRITTEVRENKSVLAQEQKIVLSKPEIYEAMAKKNPYLEQLKNGLNLQIEY